MQKKTHKTLGSLKGGEQRIRTKALHLSMGTLRNQEKQKKHLSQALGCGNRQCQISRAQAGLKNITALNASPRSGNHAYTKREAMKN